MVNRIHVGELLGKPVAISEADGRLLAARLEQAYATHPNQPIEVSFAGLQHVTTGFLNGSWGHFLMQTPSLEQRQCRHDAVQFTNLAPDAERTTIVEKLFQQINRKALDVAYRARHNQNLMQAAYA